VCQYELQPVLEHREHLEESARRRMGAAQRRLAEIQGAIAKCRDDRRALSAQWLSEVQAGIMPGRQELFNLWRGELRARLERLIEHEQRQQEVVEQRRQALAAAHRELRKFELHRDREQEAFFEKQATLERKFLDDLTIMRHGRADLMGSS